MLWCWLFTFSILNKYVVGWKCDSYEEIFVINWDIKHELAGTKTKGQKEC